MSINVAKLELAMMQKINNASTELELLTYQKVLEQLRTGSVNTVSTYSDLPNPNENTGKLYFVESEDSVYWANASVGWVTLQSQSLSILYQWGANNFGGQLGNFAISGAIDTSSPKSYYKEYDWCIVRGVSQDFSAIKTNGTLWSWGCALNRGVHGNNTSIQCCRSSPVQEITSSENWCYFAVSTGHRSALKTDGTLWGWGADYGIGDGASTDRSSPVQEFCCGSNWCNVEASGIINNIGLRTAAIKTDGTLWVWGNSQYFTSWMLPIYLSATRSPIQEVSSSTNWSKIANIDVTNAIKTDGTLWSWGFGAQGNFGNNTTTDYASSPVQEISSSTNWVCTTARAAIKTDGTLWAWGPASAGQLGSNDIANRSSPVQEITSSTNWITVQGSQSKHAIKSDGTLWSWGENADGILANNTTASNQSSPVQEITSLNSWCYAETSAGTYRTGVGIQYITL